MNLPFAWLSCDHWVAFGVFAKDQGSWILSNWGFLFMLIGCFLLGWDLRVPALFLLKNAVPQSQTYQHLEQSSGPSPLWYWLCLLFQFTKYISLIHKSHSCHDSNILLIKLNIRGYAKYFWLQVFVSELKWKQYYVESWAKSPPMDISLFYVWFMIEDVLVSHRCVWICTSVH